MGIDVYNAECRSIVMRYSKEWEISVNRLGRWIDFENVSKLLKLKSCLNWRIGCFEGTSDEAKHSSP